jgi:hypothetical protein
MHIRSWLDPCALQGMAAQQLASLREAVSEAIEGKEAAYEKLGETREREGELQVRI